MHALYSYTLTALGAGVKPGVDAVLTALDAAPSPLTTADPAELKTVASLKSGALPSKITAAALHTLWSAAVTPAMAPVLSARTWPAWNLLDPTTACTAKWTDVGVGSTAPSGGIVFAAFFNTVGPGSFSEDCTQAAMAGWRLYVLTGADGAYAYVLDVVAYTAATSYALSKTMEPIPGYPVTVASIRAGVVDSLSCWVDMELLNKGNSC